MVFPPIGRRSFAALLAAVACASASAAPLFKPVAAPKAGTVPAMMVSALPVQVDREAVEGTGVGNLLEAALPNGHRVSILLERLETHENGDLTWIGRVVDPRREDLRAIGTIGKTGSWAEIETADGAWGVVPSQAGHDWLFNKTLAQELLPLPQRENDGLIPPRTEPRLAAKATCGPVTSMPSPQATIDLMAVITPDFVSTHGGIAGADTRLNNLVANMNAYNAASNVAITYRRVATLQASYQAASTAGDSDSTALSAITNGTGSFANVAGIRSFFGADMVAMFRGPKNAQGNSISGLAWINGDGIGGMDASDANFMYSVSGDWTFPGATLPAHELGHNLGQAHDRPNAGGGANTPYSYGHFICGTGADATCGQAGFNNTGTGFGTIMAYHRPTVAKFASPSLTCQGTQAGAIAAPCGVDGQQDTVRAINCVRQPVAAFRTSGLANCTNLATDSDNDGIPDCLEAGSGRTNGARDNDIFTNALLFSAQQYRDFLSREADADGLNFWTTSLDTATFTRQQMIEGFFNSAEFQGVISPVARLYFAYFLRIPDYGGLTFWIGQFKAGTPLANISQAFATSPEFTGRYGALSNPAFVTLVYNNVLGRAPDAGGLAFWTGQLDSGAMNRGQVMLGFSESPEYRNLIANEVYVTMMYVGMLRREPDAGGFNFWVGYRDAGNSGIALISGFLGSAEYRGRFLP
jgi:hypothetical protein